MWTDLHVSDELRALWLDRVAAARSPLPDAQPETRSAEHTRAGWLEEDAAPPRVGSAKGSARTLA